MAEEVFPSEVEEERVLVEEALLAELAERVAAVRGVVGVALPAVQRQVRPVVQPPLVREYLKSGRIYLLINGLRILDYYGLWGTVTLHVRVH